MNTRKTIKTISFCLCMALMISLLISCSPTKEELAGTYTGSYTFNENEFYVMIELREDGTYSTTTKKNGKISSAESGEYEIEGRKVKLYMSDTSVYHGSWTEYTYSNGTLKNAGHKFTK